MPKIIDQAELNHLKSIIESMRGGASISELLNHDSISLSRRTLQRRLEQLLNEEKIIAAGDGRGRRYYDTENASNKPLGYQNGTIPMKSMLYEDGVYPQDLLVMEDPASYEVSIPLSEEAREVKALINRPLGERESVSYQPEFLHSYIPNQTFYLSAECRQELAEIGKLGTNELPAGTYLRHILNRLLIDLSWNSSRLEGNTYSILETAKLLEQGVAAEGKNTTEALMILNHKAAIEMLADHTQEIGFNHYTVCNLHAMLADGLLRNQAGCGAVRSCAVGISSSVYQPLNIPQQLEECFSTILSKAAMIEDPLEASFFIMVQLPYLQAFEDVNKRTSRIVANIPMVMKNLCPLSFTEVNRDEYLNANLAVYELNRIEYLRDLFIWAYKRSCKRYSYLLGQVGAPDPFHVKYRELIKATVTAIVQQALDPEQTEAVTKQRAKELIPEKDQKSFCLIVANELSSLHMGNIMRYKLRPSEFEKWEEQ